MFHCYFVTIDLMIIIISTYLLRARVASINSSSSSLLILNYSLYCYTASHDPTRLTYHLFIQLIPCVIIQGLGTLQETNVQFQQIPTRIVVGSRKPCEVPYAKSCMTI